MLGTQASFILLLCQCVASISEVTLCFNVAAGAPVITSAFYAVGIHTAVLFHAFGLRLVTGHT